jgi:hypothetical protein
LSEHDIFGRETNKRDVQETWEWCLECANVGCWKQIQRLLLPRE